MTHPLPTALTSLWGLATTGPCDAIQQIRDLLPYFRLEPVIWGSRCILARQQDADEDLVVGLGPVGALLPIFHVESFGGRRGHDEAMTYTVCWMRALCVVLVTIEFVETSPVFGSAGSGRPSGTRYDREPDHSLFYAMLRLVGRLHMLNAIDERRGMGIRQMGGRGVERDEEG